MSKLRFILDESANKFKPGEWVEGSAEGGFYTESLPGIFIATVTKEWDLIATWQKVGKIRRKKYVQVYHTKKASKQSDAPRDLLKFAKKHAYWIGK